MESSTQPKTHLISISSQIADLCLAASKLRGVERTGIVCIGAQVGHGGTKRSEERQPEAATALRELAEAHAQPDPTFQGSIAYTCLTTQVFAITALLLPDSVRTIDLT